MLSRDNPSMTVTECTYSNTPWFGTKALGFEDSWSRVSGLGFRVSFSTD